MSTITIIDNQHARLIYDDEKRIVHHQFHSTLDSETLRAVLQNGIDMLKKHKAVKWLSDNRAIGPHSEEDTRWINEYWLPTAVAAGWKYWALVVPDDFMGRINMAEFINSFHERGVRIMVFTKLDEAQHWLENVDQG